MVAGLQCTMTDTFVEPGAKSAMFTGKCMLSDSTTIVSLYLFYY